MKKKKKKITTWIIEKNNQTARRGRRNWKRGENGFAAPPNDAIVKTQTEFIIFARRAMSLNAVLVGYFILLSTLKHAKLTKNWENWNFKFSDFVFFFGFYVRSPPTSFKFMIWFGWAGEKINLRPKIRAKFSDLERIIYVAGMSENEWNLWSFPFAPP